MYKLIYDDINKASYKGKLIDKSLCDIMFIYLTFRYRIHEETIFAFIDKDIPSSFGYSVSDNFIGINYEKFLKNYNDSDAYIVNLEFLFYFVHEMEHARQFKFINSLKYDDIKDPLVKLEHLLITSSFIFTELQTEKNPNEFTDEELRIINELGFPIDNNVNNKIEDLYRNNHDLVFTERLANIKAIQFVYNLIDCNDKSISKKKKALALYKGALYRYLYDNSYDYINHFMNTLGFRHKSDEICNLIDQINDAYNLDDETRVMYGLDVNRDVLDSFYELYKNNYSIFEEEDKKLNFWRFRRIKSKIEK